MLLWTTDRLPARRLAAGCSPRCRCSRPATSSAGSTRRPPTTSSSGFPSYWNVVAFYAIVLDLGQPGDGGRSLVVSRCWSSCRCATSTRRAPKLLRSLNLALAGVWLVTYAVLLAQYPDPNPVVVALASAYLVYYVGLSVYLTVGAPAAGVTPGASSPAARSATRSAVSSMPQDSRTNPGATASPPHWARRSIGAVHAAEARRRRPQPRAREQRRAPRPRRPGRRRPPRSGRSICRAASANDGSPARHGQRTPVTGRGAGQQLGDRGRVRRLPGQPQVQRAHRAVPEPRLERARGVAGVVAPALGAGRRASSSVGAHVAQEQVAVPGERLGVAADREIRAERPAGAGRAAWPSCCPRRRRAPAACAARATAAMSHTSSRGLLGVSRKHQPGARQAARRPRPPRSSGVAT